MRASSPGSSARRPLARAHARDALEVTVAVASHDRPLRLRWLLDALRQQTLDQPRWEVIVCHDSRDSETDVLLAEHPLTHSGSLRSLRVAPGEGAASHKRNVAWRAGRAALVAFTDDDCRPEPDWLARLLETASAHPGAVLQGRTYPDPDEAPLLAAAPHARSQQVDPPGPWAQSCNVLYPRALLERLGGFEERMRIGGEDTDLALRARALGADYVAAPQACVRHAVESMSLVRAVRHAWRWRDLPAVVRRHPQVRRELAGRLFWRSSHGWLLLALMALPLSRRLGTRAALRAALALPWALSALPARGNSARGRLRAISELPGRAAIDAAELLALAQGSVRHRTLML